ncbi:MAG: hypothetical protein FJ161_04285 [Gammaproteobacteria bacterium]|nr:hypothetical protein [Gammaproteobacteria bacterium]
MRTVLSFFISAPYNDRIYAHVVQLIASQGLVMTELRVFSEKERSYLHARVEGSWDAIAKCEIALDLLTDDKNWHIEYFRPHGASTPMGISYTLSASFREDDSQTIAHLMTLFSDLKVFLENVSYQVIWLDEQHEYALARVNCGLKIPFDLSIQLVRERFYTLCDMLHVDGSIEMSESQQRV